MSVTTAKAVPETSDKWEVQVRKGCLELAILAVLWSGRLYGLEILRRLEEGSALIVPEGTVYPLLNRLKAEGLLASEWVEADAGHPRKYYKLTAVGRRRAVQMAEFWSTFSANLDSLLAPLRLAPLRPGPHGKEER
ncbi:MAG TPA: helix-turn-helix transcriptional regulator [Terriglobales bacterium]|nr:helix-turn-helix transcriptional regulator [Terriglobales bacterium]